MKNHQGDTEEIQEPEEKFQNIKNGSLTQMLLKISKGKVQTKSSGTHLKSNLLRQPVLSNTGELPTKTKNSQKDEMSDLQMGMAELSRLSGRH